MERPTHAKNFCVHKLNIQDRILIKYETASNFLHVIFPSANELMSANTKGLLTRQRQPKASAHALRQRYQHLAMDAHPRFTGDELLDILIRFKPHHGNEYPITFKHHRLPALIREERVNTTIRKRSAVDDTTAFYGAN